MFLMVWNLDRVCCLECGCDGIMCFLIFMILLKRIFGCLVDRLKMFGCVWFLILSRFLNLIVVRSVDFMFLCFRRVFVVIVVFMCRYLMLLS